MAKPRRSWSAKLYEHSKPVNKTVLEKPFAGYPAGATLVISTPLEVKKFIDAIPAGHTRTVEQLRAELAADHQVDGACPLTTGIFCRIVAEEALEAHAAGVPDEAITPFWRLVDPDSRLAGKISCGSDFIRKRLAAEAVG